MAYLQYLNARVDCVKNILAKEAISLTLWLLLSVSHTEFRSQGDIFKNQEKIPKPLRISDILDLYSTLAIFTFATGPLLSQPVLPNATLQQSFILV